MKTVIVNMLKNYISILSNTIPRMISGTSPAERLGIYCAVAVLYPLALVVLLGLTAVAGVAVFIIHPFLNGKGNHSLL